MFFNWMENQFPFLKKENFITLCGYLFIHQ